MMKRTSILALLLLVAPAFAGIEVKDDKATGLKKLVVTHWLSKESGPKGNPFRSTTESITLYVEKDGKSAMIIPVSMNPSAKKNEVSGVAWISEDLLPSIRVSISGFGASANAEGQFSENYRYVTEKKGLELIKPKPLNKPDAGDSK